ncbi:MAG: hypothetical protein AAF553_04285 [Pseudomonadota bacterium]
MPDAFWMRLWGSLQVCLETTDEKTTQPHPAFLIGSTSGARAAERGAASKIEKQQFFYN